MYTISYKLSLGARGGDTGFISANPARANAQGRWLTCSCAEALSPRASAYWDGRQPAYQHSICRSLPRLLAWSKPRNIAIPRKTDGQGKPKAVRPNLIAKCPKRLGLRETTRTCRYAAVSSRFTPPPFPPRLAFRIPQKSRSSQAPRATRFRKQKNRSTELFFYTPAHIDKAVVLCYSTLFSSSFHCGFCLCPYIYV